MRTINLINRPLNIRMVYLGTHWVFVLTLRSHSARVRRMGGLSQPQRGGQHAQTVYKGRYRNSGDVNLLSGRFYELLEICTRYIFKFICFCFTRWKATLFLWHQWWNSLTFWTLQGLRTSLFFLLTTGPLRLLCRNGKVIPSLTLMIKKWIRWQGVLLLTLTFNLVSSSGVPHGADLFYIFGVPFTDVILYSDQDRESSERMMAMWSNYVKTGWV